MTPAKGTHRRSSRKIAVPTDFSPAATAAMVYALGLAKNDRSKVTAVHAIDPFDYRFGPNDLRQIKRDAAWTQAQESMSTWLNAHKFSNCAPVVIEGEAGPAIAQFIDDEAIDLTILGTSGRRRVARLLLGSVAEEIFRQANCLVLVLGPKMRARQQQLRRLVFATDVEPHSLAVLSSLSKLVQKFDSTVSVIRAVHTDIKSRTERARIRMETTSKIKATATPNLRKKIKTIRVSFGPPVEVITKFARASKADAIVMGIRSGGELDRASTHIPWAIAHRVIADATCPVLTIRG